MRNDLRFAIRAFRKRPGFTAVAVLTLGLGIGANTAVFTMVNAFLIKPLPFRDASRLVAVSDVQPPHTLTPASLPEFEDWRSSDAVFEGITAQFPRSRNITSFAEPMRVRVMQVARGYFTILGVDAVAGRTFSADEHKPGAAATVLISSALWHTRFGGAPDAIGKSLVIDAKPYTIVGVIPSEPFNIATRTPADLWTPLERDPPWTNRGTHYLQVIGRLRAGVTWERAESAIGVLASQLESRSRSGHLMSIEPLRQQMFGTIRPTLLLLLAAAGFLLLIATVNVANLLLARATSRSREFAIRAAIGASRWRIVRQALMESVVLASGGAVLGLALSAALTRLLAVWWPSGFPKPGTWQPDWRVLAFLCGVSLVSAVVFGLAPAVQVSMTAVTDALKQGAGNVPAGARGRARSALVISEVAVACVLLIGSGLLLKSFWRLMQVDPGFRAENVLTMSVALPQAKYPKPGQRQEFFDEVLRRLRAMPGTIAAGAILNLPLAGGGMNGDFAIAGRSFPKNQEPVAEKICVTPDYFRTMGMRLERGRWFTEQDGTPGRYVAIVNEALAREFFPHEDPVGKRIDVQVGDVAEMQEIVGVVADVHIDGLDAAAGYQTYVPYKQLPSNGMILAIRTAADPAAIAAEARRQVLAVDREQPVSNVKTMRQVVSDSVAGRRMSAAVVAAFAFFALVLACIGIYGVVSYWVTQRTREIGIRGALGARRGDIFSLVLGQGMMLAGCGLAAGVAASLLVTRYLGTLLFGVSARDATILTAVPVVLAVVALAACAIPARRASRIHPLLALRFE